MLFYLGPESLRMIHLDTVAKLVYDDIFPDIFRQHHKKTVEIQIAGRRTASPSGTLVSYRDPSVAYAYLTRPFFCQRRKICKRLFCQIFYFICRKRRRLLGCEVPLGHFFEILRDPCGFLPDKSFDLRKRHMVRSLDHNAQVGPDAYLHGFSS